jgi:hypothetical protein
MTGRPPRVIRVTDEVNVWDPDDGAGAACPRQTAELRARFRTATRTDAAWQEVP